MSAESLIIDVLQNNIESINESNVDELLNNWSSNSPEEALMLKNILIDKNYPVTVGFGYPNNEDPRINYVYVSEGEFIEEDRYIGMDGLPTNTFGLGPQGIIPKSFLTISGKSETNILISSSGFYQSSLLSSLIRAVLIKERTALERHQILNQKISCFDIKYAPSVVNRLVIRMIKLTYNWEITSFDDVY